MGPRLKIPVTFFFIFFVLCTITNLLYININKKILHGLQLRTTGIELIETDVFSPFLKRWGGESLLRLSSYCDENLLVILPSLAFIIPYLCPLFFSLLFCLSLSFNFLLFTPLFRPVVPHKLNGQYFISHQTVVYMLCPELIRVGFIDLQWVESKRALWISDCYKNFTIVFFENISLDLKASLILQNLSPMHWLCCCCK